MRFLAIIPAKGASTMIPKKNIIDFFGKPLIHYTIEAAIGSKIFDKIIVTSEDDEVIQSVAEFSEIQIIKRPYKLAVDPASVMDVCNYVLDVLAEEYDYVFIMLPSTPLRDSNDVREVFKMINELTPEAVISVTRLPYPLNYTFSLDEHNKLARTFPDIASLKSQEIKDYVADNGGIYALKQQYIRLKEYCPENTLAYIMPFRKSVDIDNYEDLEIAKAMYAYFIRNGE